MLVRRSRADGVARRKGRQRRTGSCFASRRSMNPFGMLGMV